MNEVWKDIKGFENYYQISNKGRIKSLNRVIYRRDGKPYSQKEQYLKQHINKKGYVYCYITKDFKSKFFQVHRLVAQAFIPNPNNLPQVNHINGDKTNNSVDNLEWISNYDNMQHSIRTGIRNKKEIYKIVSEKLSRKINQYDLNNNFIKQFNSIKQAQDELHIPNQNIVLVCQGKRKTAHNFIFKYVKE